MSSSILAGERRWVPGPARRGGMTVLGKVIVPKPLNLPSQRLENHGLDPNVEIVPKGSLSWGSRSSSSASNPWGSSALSPNADGSSGSPSHLSGRPSSGGSGRPSTAGSDRTQEATASAWGPNSRPSSASGASTGNQTSLTSLRPRSAETRPGSSPLSRFAEPSSDNAGAWVPTGTVDKLVVASSKNDGFSLSSGDFPTLGSEKDNAGKTNESQDHGSHGRPSSSSGRAAHAKEKAVTPQADLSSGNVNSWKRDGSQHVEDQPIADKWQGDPQQYMNPNIPPQQFDSWHGPPMNGPPGVWYRGPPPGGPPYPPVAPGGYPMEPFPYYRPQFPAPPSMVNSQPVPHPGAAGPRVHHPSNVDLYRPHAPDAYIRPGMPIRPGFYPGPVAYESYYGPPMGYCNSSEKDIPYMGMVGAPPVHGMYPSQNTPEAGSNHARGGVRGPAVKPSVSEQVDSGHTEETRGPFKVLMKQHNEWGGKEEEDNWEHLEKGDQPRRVLPKNEWGADNRRDEEMYSRTTPGENFSKQGTYTSDKAKAVDDRGGRKSEISAVSSPARVRPTTPKDPTLIQKIEGLNAKARGTDGRQDTAFGSGREDQKNMLHVVNAKSNHSTNEVAQTTGDLIPAFHKEGVSTGGDKIIQSTAASAVTMPRRSYNVMQGRVDDRGKGRVNNQDTDAWRKKHQVANPSRPVSAAKNQDHAASVETDEKSEIDLPRKDEEEMFDPSDCQAQHQREKMRELAKQRAIQLQREEEERIREQKAKALAKLEELNRRTQAADGSIHKLEKAPPSGAPQQEQPVVSSKQMMHETRDEPPSSALAPNRTVPAHASEKHTAGVVESTLLSRDANLEKPKNAEKEPVVSHGQSLSLKPDARSSSASDSAAAGPQAIDTSVSRQKRMGYKQKQSNTQVEKNSTEKLIEVSATEAPKARSSMSSNELESTQVVPSETGSSSEPSLQDSSHFMPESLSHQKRKNNRNSKSKPKMDDNSPHPAIPSPAPRETNADKTSSGNGKPKISSDQSQMDPSSVQPVTSVTRDPSLQPSEQHSSLPSEEAQGRGNYQWKPQHSRRVQRNPQTNRPAGSGEAVIWAPVRPQNKTETVDESSLKNVPEVVVTTAAAAAKTDDLGQNNVKSKRAEMERYVPKPAAKEQLSQQGIVQQPIPSSVSPTGRAESGFQGKAVGGSTKLEAKNGDAKQKQPISSSVSPTGRAESGYQGKAVGGSTNLEAKNGDAKQKQPGKTHGAWRQRGPVESSHVQGSSFAPNQGKNVQKYMDQQESFKPPVIDPVKKEEQEQLQQPIASGEWNDGWHMPDEPPPVVAAAVTSSGVKDQGAMIGRGKRYPHKGHRNNQDYADQGNNTFGDTEISQQENRGVGEQKPSQWQAKSQSNYQRGGSRSSGIKKDFPNMQQDNEFMYENKYGGGKTTNVGGHQDGRRERKGVGSSKGRPHSPNEGFVGPTEEEYSSSSMDASQSGQQQQQFSSGFRKNGSQNNNRSVRGHEPRGEWSSGVQDNKPPPNRERRRQNSHYEYQPVGSSYNNINNNNNSKSNNFEGPRDGSRNFGSRNRERAQGQDGRNSYGQHQQQQQQSVTVQADSGNDWQE